PNTGKTTLFNGLTGSTVRVGNYPGITVERSLGHLKGVEHPIDVLDVPGAYSLVARSAEERIAVDALLGHGGVPSPALVVVVLDATALERNLYFALQVIELGRPTLIALNQMDAAEAAGVQIDCTALSDALGVPVVPTVGTDIERVSALAQRIAQYVDKPPRPPAWPWTPSGPLQADVEAVAPHFPDAPEGARQALALWALMSVSPEDSGAPPTLRTTVAARLAAAEGSGRDLDLEIAQARYGWIDAHAPTLLTRTGSRRLADKADRLLLHPVVGFGAFVAVMALCFQALFAWADPFIGLVEGAIGALAGGAHDVLPPGIAADFVADALIGGVGNVLVFLPQI
ncbi:MAG: ferrous iron transporter B, partial [Myxococcales bacterium]|nr:ferrous iron transporter B [Myxococcales bacterium]